MNVYSFNQQGGITAGVVNILQAPKPNVKWTMTGQRDGHAHYTLTLDPADVQVPYLTVVSSASSEVALNSGGAMLDYAQGTLGNGAAFACMSRPTFPTEAILTTDIEPPDIALSIERPF